MAPLLATFSALMLLASGVQSLPALHERQTSLSCPASDGATYTATSGTDYVVQCSTDHYGGDLGLSWTDTLEECINSCDTTPTCLTVSWVGPNRGPCYMKSEVQPGVLNQGVWAAVLRSALTSTTTTSSSTSATLPTSSSVTTHVCPSADASIITAPSGAQYVVECGIDHFGADISNQLANSLDDCVALCDSTSGCVDVSWNGPGPGSCYMKSAVQQGLPNAGIWGARLQASTSSSTTSSSSTSSSTSTPTPTSHSCPANNGTTFALSSGKFFLMECYLDRFGGDISNQLTGSLEECAALCDSTTGCLGVSWIGPAPGSCYMKNSLQSGNVNSAVWGGQIVLTPSTSGFTSSAVSDPTRGSGTETVFDGPMNLGAGPVSTLTPLPPLGVDMGSLDVLTPQPTSQLWYGGGSSTSNNSTSDSTSSTYVRLNITFEYPSIILDNSIYIQNVACSGGILTGSFDNPTAFSYAQRTWPTGSDILFITAASTCGTGGQNSFFLATSISFDNSGNTFTATGSTVQLADVFSNLGIDFGEIPVDDTPILNGTASNSTSKWSNSTSTYGCSSPNTSLVDGLPAVACGPAFDQTLDDFLGYYSGDDADTQNVTLTIVPGLKYPSSGIVSRCWCCCSIVHAVQQAVKIVAKVIAPIFQVVVKAAAPIVKIAVAAVATVAKAVVATVANIASSIVSLAVFIVTGKYSRSFDMPLSLGPPKILLTDSPWGEAFKFYTFKRNSKDPHYSLEKNVIEKISGALIGDADPEPGIDLYCVNCGIQGDIKATGSITATPLSGFTQGQISISGNLYAGLFIGLDAFAEWDAKVEKTLFTMGLPGFSIPDIFDLGPTLSLGVSADLDIQAEGQVLVGASMTWSSIAATLDFFDKSKSSQSGFSPVTNHTVQADGSLTVTSTLGLPVTLGFGINILKGKWDKEIKLVDTPGIAAKLEYDLDIGETNGALNTTPANGCYGIGWDVGFVNQLQLDLSDFDGPTFTLVDWAGPPLADGCIGEAAFTNPPSATPTASSSTSSTVPTPTPTDTLKVLNLNYGGMDQTAAGIKNFVVGQQISIDMSAITPPLIDAWGGNFKTVTILFEYGADMRIFIAQDGAGTFLLGPGDVSHYPNTNEVAAYPAPAGASITILAIAWGMGDIRDPAVYAKIYALAASGGTFEWGNDLFNGDTWSGIQKTGVIFYKDASGAVQSLTGREYTYSSFPAPPFVKGTCESMTCPANDGATCTANGKSFKISCTTAYGANQLANLCFPTLAGCIDACANATYASCTGVSYFSWAGNGCVNDPWDPWMETNCYPFAVAQNPYTGEQANSGWSVTLVPTTRKRDAIPEPKPLAIAAPAIPKRTPIAPRARSTRRSPPPSARSLSLFPRQADTTYSNTTASNSTSDDFIPITITDTTSTLLLSPSTNGSLFVSLVNSTMDMTPLTNGAVFAGSPPSTITNSSATTIFGDSLSRLLHYFPSSMSAVGASRLRLAAWGSIPIGAELVNLVPFTVGSDTVLVAVDSLGNYFFPFVCGIEGQLNKVFLVKDASNGASVLESADLMYTVVGGVASNCSPLALTASGLTGFEGSASNATSVVSRRSRFRF